MRTTGRIRALARATILAAAERVFAEKGLEGATTAAIARAAGLPKANVHYYFSTKEALYRCVLEEILRTWLSTFDRFGPDDDPATALRSYVVDKVRLSFARSHASRVFAREMLGGGERIRSFLEHELKDWVDERTRVMRAWIETGRLRPLDPHQLLFTIWAATQTYADFAPQVRAVRGGDPDEAAQIAIAQEIAELIVHACLPVRVLAAAER